MSSDQSFTDRVESMVKELRDLAAANDVKMITGSATSDQSTSDLRLSVARSEGGFRQGELIVFCSKPRSGEVKSMITFDMARKHGLTLVLASEITPKEKA